MITTLWAGVCHNSPFPSTWLGAGDEFPPSPEVSVGRQGRRPEPNQFPVACFFGTDQKCSLGCLMLITVEL